MRIDLKKDLKAFYQPGPAEFVEVHLPPRRYLAVDGRGDPNTSPDYAAAVSALYASGYAVKFALRARTGDDFVVGPLEGLWTSDDPTSFTGRRKDEWNWTMLIPLPDVVTADDVATGLAAAAARKPELPVDSVRRPHHEIYLSDPRRVAPERLRTVLRQPVRAV